MHIHHTMIRVSNLEDSIKFYTEVLGMKIYKQKDYPEGRFTLVFLGYDQSEQNTLLELTYNWDLNEYDLGTGYGHVALSCQDVYETCCAIRAKGGKITREPGPMKTSGKPLAFIEDPDGYKIEIIQA